MLPHKKISILVVDDELSIRESLSGWLQQDGYQVESAADGPAALARAQETHYDIMLIDVKMPGMDGITPAQEISRKRECRYRCPHDDCLRRPSRTRWRP